jgi:hypothetical protein
VINEAIDTRPDLGGRLVSHDVVLHVIVGGLVYGPKLGHLEQLVQLLHSIVRTSLSLFYLIILLILGLTDSASLPLFGL